MSAPFKAYRNGDNPDYDFFKSTPANTHMRTTSNRKAFVVAPSRLGAMTGISAAGCKPLDEERTKTMTLADWAQRYGQPGAKSHLPCGRRGKGWRAPRQWCNACRAAHLKVEMQREHRW